jgi:hypothetical protein
MARLAADRPELTRYVSKADPVWQFCARAFAGELLGERIRWDSGLPANDYPADHATPTKDQKAFIRVRKTYASGENRGQPLSCEELWACVVFELENIRSSKAFLALHERGLRGELTREQWIGEHTRLEYNAFRRTAHNYARLWQPIGLSRALTSQSEQWGIGLPPTYEAWLAQYRDPNGYPWNPYGRFYDNVIVPYVHFHHR